MLGEIKVFTSKVSLFSGYRSHTHTVKALVAARNQIIKAGGREGVTADHKPGLPCTKSNYVTGPSLARWERIDRGVLGLLVKSELIAYWHYWRLYHISIEIVCTINFVNVHLIWTHPVPPIAGIFVFISQYYYSENTGTFFTNFASQTLIPPPPTLPSPKYDKG